MDTLYTQPEVLPDDIIIRRVVEGETTLFATLVRKYNPLLYKIARTYCANHEDAEDMMQESHYAAYLQLKYFRGDASYKTWITKILVNNCYHLLRYRQKKMLETNVGSMQDLTYDIQDSSEGQNKVFNKELGKLLEQSLQTLPLIYRTVFILRKVEGFSVAETAEILEITTTNVKIRLNRAKALLRKHMGSYYSLQDIYDFNLKYCNPLADRVMSRINRDQNIAPDRD